MIERLRTLSLTRRHPRSEVLSRYLEDDLDARGRDALESHLRDCARCRRELASLVNTIRSLGSLEAHSPRHLADSIVAAVRAADPPEAEISRRAPGVARLPALTVVSGSSQPTDGDRLLSRWPQEARAALRWCLQRPQLRLTLPITLVAGVVLSLVNMGGMLIHGRIDLGVCVMCATDFVIPFVALNLILVVLLRARGLGRAPGRGDRAA